MARYHYTEKEESADAMSDGELIGRYLGGDQRAFDVLYQRYRRQIYAYLNRLGCEGKGANADDMFQQTWLRIIEKLPGYQCRRKFLAWAFRIAHNLVMDQYRRTGRRGEVGGDEALEGLSSDAQPWHAMDRRELGAALERAIRILSPELREVFLLRMEKMSFKEIAEIQGCSINTALGRMQYAMKNLRRVLCATEYGGGGE